MENLLNNFMFFFACATYGYVLYIIIFPPRETKK